jgi:hypothetical protein
LWRSLESDVVEESSNFGGKLELPATLLYLLPKVDELEVNRHTRPFLKNPRFWN